MNTSAFTLKRSAIIAGIAYLAAILVTPYPWIQPHISIGDAATTFANIAGHERLFRLAIACWLVVIIADAIAGWALFHFFCSVNKALSLLAMALRFVFVPIMALAVFQWLGALQVITGATSLSGTALLEAQELAMFYFTAYEYAVNIAFMVFGLHVGLIGYLAFRSGYVPRILGVLLMVASVGYQIDTYASILSAGYAAQPYWFFITIAVPAALAEIGFTLWLLIKGARLKERSD